NATNHGKGRFGSEQRNVSLLPEIERTDIIQPKNVIGMGVGEDHRVQMLQQRTKRLRPEIGRGIDHNVVPGVLHQNGGSQALVARVFGTANRTRTADSRHA
ncbi:MAG: hypothetical protein QOJ99_3467, partial [Bryobacterales bacterium]|nr:hypothetical protein [Bryobacterales bacterium]